MCLAQVEFEMPIRDLKGGGVRQVSVRIWISEKT